MPSSSARLIDALHNPACYDHPVDRVELVETHISWIFLAGDYAYKLKKPVNFGFLDFSTLDKRRHYCNEELRLNRRFAPDLYLEVISLGGNAPTPLIGGSPASDYLVKMKRFSRQNELDRLLQNGLLTVTQIESFADYLADLHQNAPRIEQNPFFGTPTAVNAPVEENFNQILPLLPKTCSSQQLQRLAAGSRLRFQQLRELLQERKNNLFIRECHGDVHLANMVWHEGQPLLFDCIEFNDNFRCIDTVNDYAFLLMDLEDRGAKELSWAFLNRYLQQSGDYQGLLLLDYYCSYRAMVRAKVSCLRLAQAGLSQTERTHELQLLQSYLDLAERYLQPRATALIISHGVSGSGKSTFIRQLAPLCRAVSVHSDIERKRLHGLTATAPSASPLRGGIYSQQATLQTYERLAELATTALKAGFSTIIDATFLKRQQRNQMRALAERLRIPFTILDFKLDEELLFQRVAARSRQREQISEATPAVLRKQLQQHEPLTAGERELAVRVFPDSSATAVAAQISCR